MLQVCLRLRERHSHLNLAVSGSISRSSRTGDRGTLAENFSRKRGENKSRAFQSGVSSRIKMAQCLKMTELMVFATWAGRQSDGIEMQNWFTRLYVFGPYLWAASSLDNTLAKLSQVTSRYPCKLHQLAIQRCLPLLWGPRCLPPFPHLPPIGEAMREQIQFHFLFFHSHTPKISASSQDRKLCLSMSNSHPQTNHTQQQQKIVSRKK